MAGYYTIQILQGLSGDRSYLSCATDGRVDLWTQDDGSGRQRWVLTPFGSFGAYLISVYGGMSGGATYLVWDDSQKVSVGERQYSPNSHDLWTVEPVSADDPPPSDFHIRPFRHPNLFLSCSADGSVVDLWNQDDGSGRQRWQMQGPIYAPGG